MLDNLSSLAGFKTGDPDCWTELQRFLTLQRRSGRAVLVLHHANKEGKQRGTNRREDISTSSWGSSAPPTAQDTRRRTHFSTHYDQPRGLHGEAIDPIEARIADRTSLASRAGTGRRRVRP